eukprot:TRINITY_DN1936_c2_g2_i3.p2 TRINITY_DN1936_c2_g2~~TRINITY_DN1936_c2_g2_i3.p2  ORF type:complete len:444 (+),score=120.16 TRINITY_DN1936_c2_g2_i3:56-1387(+)
MAAAAEPAAGCPLVVPAEVLAASAQWAAGCAWGAAQRRQQRAALSAAASAGYALRCAALALQMQGPAAPSALRAQLSEAEHAVRGAAARLPSQAAAGELRRLAGVTQGLAAAAARCCPYPGPAAGAPPPQPALAAAPPPPPAARVRLRGGGEMPVVGFGTGIFGAPEGRVEVIVARAAAAGYRHFDCATGYGTQREVGRGLAAAGLPRAELFVTAKLSGAELTPGAVRRLVGESLSQLGLSYLDLCMFHARQRDPARELLAWRALEAEVDAGRVRALGLANYGAADARRVLSTCRVPPSVVQHKWDCYLPGFFDPQEGLATVGYSTLSGWPYGRPPVADPIVVWLGGRLGLAPSELLLRHALGRGVGVLPRSSDAARARANLAAAAAGPLPPGAAAVLDGLARLASLAPSPPPWLPEGLAAPRPAADPKRGLRRGGGRARTAL